MPMRSIGKQHTSIAPQRQKSHDPLYSARGRLQARHTLDWLRQRPGREYRCRGERPRYGRLAATAAEAWNHDRPHWCLCLDRLVYVAAALLWGSRAAATVRDDSRTRCGPQRLFSSDHKSTPAAAPLSRSYPSRTHCSCTRLPGFTLSALPCRA